MVRPSALAVLRLIKPVLGQGGPGRRVKLRGPGAAVVTSSASAPRSTMKLRFGAFVLTKAGRCG